MGTNRANRTDVTRRRDTAESNITFREVFNTVWSITTRGPKALRILTVPVAVLALVVAYILLGVCDVLFAPVHVARRIRWAKEQAEGFQAIEQLGQQQMAIQQAYLHRQADLRADLRSDDTTDLRFATVASR